MVHELDTVRHNQLWLFNSQIIAIVIYISFTKLYLKYFVVGKENEIFKQILDENEGDFLMRENSFMMVFFYSSQSIALSMAIYMRLRQADVIIEEFKGEYDL